MNQEQFIAKYEAQWQVLEAYLSHHEHKKKSTLPADDLDLPHAYRQLSHQLSLARSRMYAQHIIDRLSQLSLRAHQLLYTRKANIWQHITQYITGGFAWHVRQQWRSILLSCLLFFGSSILIFLLILNDPKLVYTILSINQAESMEAMYDPAIHSRLGRIRQADSDILMFGHYIKNNTSIGFQTFSGGLLFGLGTLFFLLYNGLFLGAAAAHLTNLGFIETFWGFVAGHSAMELIAIVISGAAGFKLSIALIKPGRKTRFHALRDNAIQAIQLMYGAMLLFFIAAFIEAFWSSIAILPVELKYLFGITLWILLISYFLFAGRNRHAA